MLGTRILVIFSEFVHTEQLVDTLLDAIAQAARPFGMRFAVPQSFQQALAELPEEIVSGQTMHKYVMFYPERGGLAGALAVRTDETHFLSVRGEHRFAAKWDQGLLSRHRKLPEKAVLTLVASAEAEGLLPQAYLPALSGVFGGQGVQLARGLPLGFAAEPVKTLLIYPPVLFGKLDYLTQADTRRDLLSIAAFVAEYGVYALEVALLWPVRLPRTYFLACPDADTLPRHFLNRFEQFAGFSFEKKRTGARSAMGLFSSEDVYPQKMPGQLTLSQKAKAMVARASHPLPLMVTAFADLPERLKPTVEYVAHFSFLKGLKAMPLLLYAGGPQERSLRLHFPNTLSYPDGALLPRSLLADGMTLTQLFRRNKLLLLQRAAKAHPEFSHFAWVNFDILPHPICPEAVPDFQHLMDGQVHLATVDGEPDASFMVVPYRHLKLLCREVYALSQVDAAIKRSFNEGPMLRRLIEKFPDLFTLHPMPEKHLLMMTGFDSLLLCEEVNVALMGIWPPPGSEAPKGPGLLTGAKAAARSLLNRKGGSLP